MPNCENFPLWETQNTRFKKPTKAPKTKTKQTRNKQAKNLPEILDLILYKGEKDPLFLRTVSKHADISHAKSFSTFSCHVEYSELFPGKICTIFNVL